MNSEGGPLCSDAIMSFRPEGNILTQRVGVGFLLKEMTFLIVSKTGKSSNIGQGIRK